MYTHYTHYTRSYDHIPCEALPPGVFDKLRSFFAALTEEDGWTPQKNRKGEVLYGLLATSMNNLNVSWWPKTLLMKVDILIKIED